MSEQAVNVLQSGPLFQVSTATTSEQMIQEAIDFYRIERDKEMDPDFMAAAFQIYCNKERDLVSEWTDKVSNECIPAISERIRSLPDDDNFTTITLDAALGKMLMQGVCREMILFIRRAEASGNFNYVEDEQ